MENIKASLAHGCGDQAVLEGRHHTAGADRWPGPLGVGVMWRAEGLQLPVKPMDVDAIGLKGRVGFWLIGLQVST